MFKRLIANVFDGQSFTAPNIVKDYEETFVNNNITKTQYCPNIDRTYNIFEQDYDNTEMMLLAQEGINMGYDKWVKAFAQALKGEKVQSTEVKEYKLGKKKTAEINVGDLPKIIWHEEEYRVLFSKDGEAEILNNFGNHVWTLHDTYTIKQVNAQLADKEIVPEDYRQDDDVIVIENLTQKENTNTFTTPQPLLASEEIIDEDLIDETTANITDKRYNAPHYALNPIELYDDIELDEEDEEKFHNGICPYCDTENLELIDDKNRIWTFICNECNAKYNVDSETGEIILLETKDMIKEANDDNLSQDIELLNKTLFIEEMEKRDYDASMIDMLITHIEYDNQEYEVDIILKDNYISNIISYIDNETVDTPNEVYRAIMQDIDECNIE